MEVRRFRVITILADIAILAVSFMIMVWYKPASLRSVLPSHYTFFLALVVMWLVVSVLNGKMYRGKIVNYTSLFTRVLTSNIIAVSITALLMYTLRHYSYSRTVVLGTAILTTILELLTGIVYVAYKKAKLQDYEENENDKPVRQPDEYNLVKESVIRQNGNGKPVEAHPSILKALEREVGPEMTARILKLTSRDLNEQTAVLSTTTVFNIHGLPREKYESIINLHKINDIKRIDEFLDAVNSRLKPGGNFLCCVETKDQRKRRILRKYPPVLNYILYSGDFVIKRIFPKFRFTRGLYYFLTRGENAVLSRAEALGRLSRAGFKISHESFIARILCIEAIKTREPVKKNGINHGPLIALPRVGKGGDIIKVYKLRTMHPYSEYIQDYVYRLHDLQDGGKFKNDFRITSWGAFCRKVWLDEVPMFINLLKGEMKLFGVRPLSKHYFNLYRPEVRERRVKYKPGLIPPYYADMPEDLDAIQASELKYFDAYDKHPLLTDVKYIFRSGWNIVVRKARSK